MATRYNEPIVAAIAAFVRESPANRSVHLDGGPFWVEPLVGFASGDDALFEEYKEIVGEFHMTPREIMSLHLADAGLCGTDADTEEINVISWVLPASQPMRRSNRRETECPSIEWAHGRDHGERLNRLLREHVVSLVEQLGGQAVAPMLSVHFETKRFDSVGWGSNWSERHVAYACGLGTFGLSDGLISPKGMAMRLGSVVTTLKLEPSRRLYASYRAYCLFYRGMECGKCIPRCPVGAISEHGHDKDRCHQFNYGDLVPKQKEYGVEATGCGLCQTKVPCEFQIPDCADVLED